MSVYFVGLDLGQARDYSALAVLEVEGVKPKRLHKIRHLQRWRLGTSYSKICDETADLMQREPLHNSPLIVDSTGVGRPVVDLFTPKPRLVRRLHAVSITGGSTESKELVAQVTYWNVPKRILVSNVQVLLQDRRLKVASELSDAKTLTSELQDFQVKITTAGNDTYGAWREGAHDDLVLSVALSCWGAATPELSELRVGVLALGAAKGWGVGHTLF
jgi:hypothetical protein